MYNQYGSLIAAEPVVSQKEDPDVTKQDWFIEAMERVEYDQMKAFEGADFVYAKNWAAYTGDNYGQILSKDRTWTVGERQMAVTNNAYFMHCLPVRRNMIVTDDVIESPQSIVIPEAANREISATVVLKRLLESL